MEELPLVVATIAVAFIFWFGFKKWIMSGRALPKVSAEYRPMIVSVGHWIISLLALIFILRIYGFTAGQVLASLSTFALVASIAFFAYWSVLSNALCSLLLFLYQPFRVGDWIEMRENENNIVAAGNVIGINLVYVTLKQVDAAGVESEYRIPANLMFQRTIRVVRGKDTTSLVQVYARRGPGNTGKN